MSLPFVLGSETSKEAANAARPDAATQRDRVLAAIRAAGSAGLTDEQIANQLAMNPSTGRPRRIELVQGGQVRDSGRTRETRSGRQAVVWTAVPRPGSQMRLL